MQIPTAFSYMLVVPRLFLLFFPDLFIYFFWSYFLFSSVFVGEDSCLKFYFFITFVLSTLVQSVMIR